MEQFESYFQRADLDRDGKISGLEAVAFFQGSNLPKPILAQVWNEFFHLELFSVSVCPLGLNFQIFSSLVFCFLPFGR